MCVLRQVTQTKLHPTQKPIPVSPRTLDTFPQTTLLPTPPKRTHITTSPLPAREPIWKRYGKWRPQFPPPGSGGEALAGQ